MVSDGAEKAMRVEVDGADGAVLARCDQHVLGHGHLRGEFIRKISRGSYTVGRPLGHDVMCSFLSQVPVTNWAAQ